MELAPAYEEKTRAQSALKMGLEFVRLLRVEQKAKKVIKNGSEIKPDSRFVENGSLTQTELSIIDNNLSGSLHAREVCINDDLTETVLDVRIKHAKEDGILGWNVEASQTTYYDEGSVSQVYRSTEEDPSKNTLAIGAISGLLDRLAKKQGPPVREATSIFEV